MLARHARANAVAYAALFVALSGTALAAGGLARNSVGTAQLKNRAVTGRKVARKTLTGANIRVLTLGMRAASGSSETDHQLVSRGSDSVAEGWECASTAAAGIAARTPSVSQR